MNLLVVEDCEDTFKLIKAFLTDHNLILASTAEEARNKLKTRDFNLALLDIELPDGSGFDICSEITQSNRFLEMSIIILTGKSSVEEKIAGLYCGADDYITKPFSGQELRARVDACLRRHKKSSKHLMYKYGFHLDVEHQKAFRTIKTNPNEVENEDLNLTPTEFRIFMTLIKDPGKAHSRRDLIKAIWVTGLNIEKRGIDTHVSHLRKKLGEDSKSIVSVYGKGYSFNPKKLGDSNKNELKLESTNKSSNKPANEQPISEPNESISKSINEPISKPINESILKLEKNSDHKILEEKKEKAS